MGGEPAFERSHQTEESLPILTKTVVPVQIHNLRVDERIAKEKTIKDIESCNAQMEWKPPAKSE